MADASERFVARAGELGVRVAVTRHPAGTRTAADAAAAIGCEVIQIVKSLVFVAQPGEEPGVQDWQLLALTSGANRVDLAVLAEVAEVATLRKATAEEARAATGYAIGGTPPFGHDHALPTYLDPALLSHERVWAAAGSPDAVFPITSEQLETVTGALVTDFAAGG